jgi:hypothetical protein
MDLGPIKRDTWASGKIDGPELDLLLRQLYASDRIDRREADYLVELHKQAQHCTPAFERFFYRAIKDHILAHGRVDAEDALWLRQMLFADGKINDEKRKFLHELKGEASQVSPAFEVLFEECMKQPPEQQTCS